MKRYLRTIIILFILSFAFPCVFVQVYGEESVKNAASIKKQGTEVVNPLQQEQLKVIVTESNPKPWWLEMLLIFIPVTVSVLVIVWQIGIQYRNSIKLQEGNHRNQFKLSIYKELATSIDSASKKTIKGNLGLLIPSSITLYFDSNIDIKYRPMDVHNAKHELIIEISKLIIFLENYEVVMPRFRIFRLAFSCAADKLGKAGEEYFYQLLTSLPTDVPEEDIEKVGARIIHPLKPSVEKFEEIKQAGIMFHEECMNAYCYMHDLRIEAQKELLGNIFGNDTNCFTNY